MDSMMFPMLVLQTNGVVTVSDGTEGAIFENMRAFGDAFPDFVMPSGVVGVNYEIRPGGLLHVQIKPDGSVVSLQDTWPEAEAIIADIAHAQAKLTEQAHPLYWITDPAEARRITMAAIKHKRDLVLFGGYLHTDGHRYDTAAQDRANITGRMITLANDPAYPAFQWRTFDNSMATHTRESFVALASAMDAWTTRVHGVKWLKEAEVEALGEDLAAIRDYYDNHVRTRWDG